MELFPGLHLPAGLPHIAVMAEAAFLDAVMWVSDNRKWLMPPVLMLCLVMAALEIAKGVRSDGD